MGVDAPGIRHCGDIRINSCTGVFYILTCEHLGLFSPVNASVLRNSKAAAMSLSPPGCVSCCIRLRSRVRLVYSLSRIESSGEFANTTTPTREKDGEIVRNSTKSETKPNINLQRTHRLNLERIHRLNLERIHRFEVTCNFVLIDFTRNPSRYKNLQRAEKRL